jgi:hypothetical protein
MLHKDETNVLISALAANDAGKEDSRPKEIKQRGRRSLHRYTNSVVHGGKSIYGYEH